MPRKAAKPVEEKKVEEVSRTETSFLEYLRFGESYTSLILGIIVVIISTALLLSFVHNRNAANTKNATTNEQNDTIANSNSNQQNFQISSVPSLSPIVTKTQPAATAVPTITIAPTVTLTPTKVVSTVMPTNKPTVVPTKGIQPTAVPAQKETPVVKEGEYIVRSGDTLWNIAERHYKSGYNWIDIARANKLSNPGVITSGTKLVLPKVTAKVTTVDTNKGVATADEHNNKTVAEAKITGNTYKIVRGDSLWSIALRAYGDGNKWVDIARANKLVNPRLIHADNTLNLPRGK